MRVVVKRTGNQHVEARVASLACGGHQVRSGHRAELGANEDSCTLLARAVFIQTFAAYQIARPWHQRREGNFVFLVRLLYSCGFKVFKNYLHEVACCVVLGLLLCHLRIVGINQFIVFINS